MTWKNLTAILALAVIVTLCGQAWAQSGELNRMDTAELKKLWKQGGKHYKKAKSYIASGAQKAGEQEYNRALEKFTAIYSQRPHNCKNLYPLAKSYEKLGSSNKAYMFFKKLIELRNVNCELKKKYFDAAEAAMNDIEDDLRDSGRKLVHVTPAMLGNCTKTCELDFARYAPDGLPLPARVGYPLSWWFKDDEYHGGFMCGTEFRWLAFNGSKADSCGTTVIAGGPECGNGICENGESPEFCPSDCYQKQDPITQPAAVGGANTWKDSTTWIAVGTAAVGGGLLAGGLLLYGKGNSDLDAASDENAKKLINAEEYNRRLADDVIPQLTLGNALMGAGGGILLTGTAVIIWDYMRGDSGTASTFQMAPQYDQNSAGFVLNATF